MTGRSTKEHICATPVVKGYARKCKVTHYAGGYLLVFYAIFWEQKIGILQIAGSVWALNAPFGGDKRNKKYPFLIENGRFSYFSIGGRVQILGEYLLPKAQKTDCGIPLEMRPCVF